jgi:hypothetical protein
MGWKTINGRRYYYKSEREGGRVKTTYFGAGESGLLISPLEREDRAEREAERDQRRADREEYRAEFGLSRFSASRGLDELRRAELVSAGRMPGRSPVVTIRDANATNG